MHTTDAVGLYCPPGHVVHVVEPATETCVALQSVHVDTEIAATTAEKVFNGHAMHAAFPSGLAVYVPATQATHCAACVRASRFCVDFPAAHDTQLPTLLPSVLTEYLPATQFTHAALPVVLLYFPAAHCVQVPALGPVHPALHRHTFVVDPSTAMFDPIQQDVHSAGPDTGL